jgi:hypothetical protein
MHFPQRMLHTADKRMAGAARDELRWVLDPQEGYGPDFPWGGETFRL